MFNIDWEPFNGMSTRPWLTFFSEIICILIGLAVVVLFGITSYSVASEESTTLVETDFSSYSVDGNELILSTSSGEIYRINAYQYYDGIFDDPTFLCDGGSYRIWVSDHGFIKAMENTEGQRFITFESEREAYRRSNKGANVLLFIFLLLYIAFFVLSLVVSKNSEWYPAWLVKVLFWHPGQG